MLSGPYSLLRPRRPDPALPVGDGDRARYAARESLCDFWGDRIAKAPDRELAHHESWVAIDAAAAE